MATFEEAKEIFLKNPDGYDCVKRLEKICKGDTEVGKWLWEGFRQNLIKPEDSWFWSSMEDAEKDYTVDDLCDFFLAISQTPSSGYGGISAEEPWNIYLENMFENHIEGNEKQLIDCWKKCSDPLTAGLGFALAELGHLKSSQLPPLSLEWRTKKLVHLSYDRDFERAKKVWKDDELGPELAKAATDLENGIWSTEWIPLAWDHATTEQRAQLVLNLDYPSTVKEALPLFYERFGDKEYKALETLLEKAVKVKDLNFYGVTPVQEHGFLSGACVLGHRAKQRGESMAKVGVDALGRWFENMNDELMDIVIEAFETVDGKEAERIVLNALKKEQYLREPYRLIAAAQTPKVIKRGVELVRKFPKGDPYEMRWALPAFEQLGPQAAQPLLDAGWDKSPQRHVIAKGLAATKNPIVIDRLIELLDDTLGSVFDAAVEGLTFHADDAKERLLALLKEKKKARRLGAAIALLNTSLDKDEKAMVKELHAKEKVAEVKALLGKLSGKKAKKEVQKKTDWDAYQELRKTAFAGKLYNDLWDAFTAWTPPHEPALTKDKAWQKLAKKHPDEFCFFAEDFLGDEIGWIHVNVIIEAWAEILKVVKPCDALRVSTALIFRYTREEEVDQKLVEQIANTYRETWGEQGLDTALTLIENSAAATDLMRVVVDLNRDKVLEFGKLHFGKKMGRDAWPGRAAFSALGEDALGDMLEFLDAKAQDVRIRTIEVAMENPSAELLKPFKARLKKEKAKAVKAALQEAIIAIEELDQTPLLELENSPEGYKEIDERFAKFDWELPKKIDTKKLSKLKWADGNKVKASTQKWVLSRMGEIEYSDLIAIREFFDADTRHKLMLSIEKQFGPETDEGRIGWVLYTKAFGATDAEMQEFGKDLDEEARFGSSARAFKCLSILCMHGSSAALQWVDHWSRKAKSKGLRAHAGYDLRDAAHQLNLTQDELSERVMSGYGFDEDGEQVWGWGKRGDMTIRLGGSNEVLLEDESEKIWKNAPGPIKGDDEDEIKAIKKEFSSLKKQIKQATKGQIERMEAAMISGRRWSEEAFYENYLGNPLIANLSRHLLWALFTDGKMDVVVRIDDDHTLADIDDNEIEFEDRLIGLAHPLMLKKAELKKWTGIFADYERMPPFDQFERVIHKLEKNEKKYTVVRRFEDDEVGSGRFRGQLERRGWLRGSPQDAGAVCWMVKPYRGANVTAVVYNSPGFSIGYYDDEPQTVEKVVFVSGEHDDVWYRSDELDLKDVNPIVFSETLRDVYSLFDSQK